MPITIDGTGVISGLSAGGLPDSSVTTSEIAAGAVTAAKLDGAQSGTAPIYGARAWVNFNGTGTIAIRGSGNVSSITDNNVGDYTVNFTTAFADANYVAAVSCTQRGGGSNPSNNTCIGFGSTGTIEVDGLYTTTQLRLLSQTGGGGTKDVPTANVVIFR
jgi:hypothetical protein